MKEIKRILAATDFSPRSGRALRRSAQLAHEHSAALYLLHVLPAFPLEAFKRLMIETPPETEQKLYVRAKATLQQEAETLPGEGIAIRQHVAIGQPHVEINHYANTHQIDLVVIGDRGESFVQELFLGTTASKTLRTGSHPLLITKQEPKIPNGAYKEVLIPVDFSRNSLHALELGCNVAKGASIHILYALDIPFEGVERHTALYEEWVDPYRDEIVNRAHEDMKAVVEDYASRNIALKPLIEHGSPSAIIREKTATLDIDLIVIGKRGETELDDALLGSVTKHVLYETACDVLVVSPPAAPHPSR